MSIKEGGDLFESSNKDYEAESRSDLTESNKKSQGSLNEIGNEVSERDKNSDKNIGENQENNNELDKKEEKGFFATLLSFIKSIISLFFGDDEKGEDIEKNLLTHSQQKREGEMLKIRIMNLN